MQTIDIEVEGGLIQNIEGIPDGIQIRVRDYDTQDMTAEDDPQLITGEGRSHTQCIWHSDGTCS